jgi:hypothetical protein
VATLVMDRRREPVFGLLAVVAIVMLLAAPVSVQEGFLLKARLLIFPYLVILPWLTPRLARWPLALALALIALGNVVYIRDRWKRNEKVMAAALAPFSAAEPHRTLLPLVYDHTTPYSHLPFLTHVASYGAAERRLVDFGDYEAEQAYFPVVFRKGLHRPPVFEIETAPEQIDAAAYDVDYVYTWKAGVARLDLKAHGTR